MQDLQIKEFRNKIQIWNNKEEENINDLIKRNQGDITDKRPEEIIPTEHSNLSKVSAHKAVKILNNEDLVCFTNDVLMISIIWRCHKAAFF